MSDTLLRLLGPVVAASCRTCEGTGLTRVYGLSFSWPTDRPCPTCSPLREALAVLPIPAERGFGPASPGTGTFGEVPSPKEAE
jgi:hypothetical protein